MEKRSISEENKDLIRREFKAFAKGEAKPIQKVHSRSFKYHGTESLGIDDFAGAKKLMATAKKAFPDMKAKLDDVIAEGNKVAYRWTFRGTHKGDYGGLAPTNKKVKVGVIGFCRIERGQIVEEWEQLDLVALLKQLGAP